MMFELSQSLSPVTSITNDLSRTTLDWEPDYDFPPQQTTTFCNSIKKSYSEPPQSFSCPISRRLVFDLSSEDELENEWLSLPATPTYGQSPSPSSPMLDRQLSNVSNVSIPSGLKKSTSLIVEKPFTPKLVSSSKRRVKGSAISPRDRHLQENVAPSNINIPSTKPTIGNPLKHFLLSKSGSVSSLNHRHLLSTSQPTLPTIPLPEVPSSPTTSPSNKKSKFSSSLEDLKEYDAECTTSPTKNFKSPFAMPPPILPTETSSDLSEISTNTMWKLCCGGFPQVTRYFVIDARFPYEFKGGHIKQALNVYEAEEIDDLFQITGPCSNTKYGFTFDPNDPANETTAFIFHCEFSSHRGPRLAKHLRALDRFANRANYPRLYYPQVFILKGGYKSFFNSNTEHQKCCEPMDYLPMDRLEYAEELKFHRRKLLRSSNSLFNSMKRPRSMSLGDCLLPVLRESKSSPNLKPL